MPINQTNNTSFLSSNSPKLLAVKTMENGTATAAAQGRPHVVMVPTHGMGHLIPMVELAKRLVGHHGFSVTILTIPSPGENKAQKALLYSLPPSIASRSLPPVPHDDLPPDAVMETVICFDAARSVPAVRAALSDIIQSGTNVVAFLADLFGTDFLDAARSFHIPAYMFFPTNLLSLSIFLYLPKIDTEFKYEYRDLPAPLELPGCVPIPGAELFSPMQDRSNDAYRWVLHQARQYGKTDGILVNSFDAIEPGATAVLRARIPGRPPIYPVGPLTNLGSPVEVDGSGCLEWLDKQPTGSVLFVSFGSGGTLSREQMDEVAMGLEQSGQRFLWVVKSPCDGKASAAYFNVTSKDDPFGFLPAGFVQRTKDIGLLVPSWAPQPAILNHAATGGFLSHCGWNSTLESMLAGVAMVAWPLYAEQRQNARLLAEGAKVAIPVRPGADGVVRKEEVARAVKELMEGQQGKAIKKRAAELREAATKGLEPGGAAFVALAEVANKWKGLR